MARNWALVGILRTVQSSDPQHTCCAQKGTTKRTRSNNDPDREQRETMIQVYSAAADSNRWRPVFGAPPVFWIPASCKQDCVVSSPQSLPKATRFLLRQLVDTTKTTHGGCSNQGLRARCHTAQCTMNMSTNIRSNSKNCNAGG